MKIFIADDSQLLRDRLKNTLTEVEGVEIIGEAEDALEARHLIEKLEPDAVILDIRMPGGSGIDVIHSIKKLHPNTVVIMLTGYPYPQYQKRCLESGADYFFDKSLGLDDLILLVNTLIHSAKCRVTAGKHRRKGGRKIKTGG